VDVSLLLHTRICLRRHAAQSMQRAENSHAHLAKDTGTLIKIFRDRSSRSSDSTSVQLTLSGMGGSSSVIRFCLKLPDAPKTIKARPIVLAFDWNLEFRLRFRSRVGRGWRERKRVRRAHRLGRAGGNSGSSPLGAFAIVAPFGVLPSLVTGRHGCRVALRALHRASAAPGHRPAARARPGLRRPRPPWTPPAGRFQRFQRDTTTATSPGQEASEASVRAQNARIVHDVTPGTCSP